MTTRPRLIVCVAISIGFGAPAVAVAQRLSLSPEIGFYLPTEKLVDAANGTVGELEAGPSFGLRVALALSNRVSLSVGGTYVPTTFAIRPGGGQPESRDARLFNGAGQLVLFVLPPSSPLSVFVNGGVGVVSRGGVAFTEEAGTSNVTGVLGGGAAIRLGGISIMTGVDLYSYEAQYQGTAAVSSTLRQLDLQLRVGIGLLGGRPMGSNSP